ncbi:MAG: site-2 protease family protein [Candidatus Heimdallarchaeota archaeon]
MEPVVIALLVIAGIWALVYILGRVLKLDERFGWTMGPLFLLMRTTRFNNIIKRIAKKHARFWRGVGNVSIVVALILMLVSFGLFIFTLVDMFIPNPVVSGGGAAVGLIIPGVTVSFKTALYLIIPIIITLVPHELAHGVVSHADGVELKSTGLAFFAIFFGAFVEPEEQSMMDSSSETKMRTYASGIFPNLIIGLIFIPFLIFSSSIIGIFYHSPDGLLILEVEGETPADIAGLTKGVALFDANETHLTNSEVFSAFMQNTTPNQLVIFNTTEGQFEIRLAANPSNVSIGYLGVVTIAYQQPKVGNVGLFLPHFYVQQTLWIIVVSFGAVMFNVLPIPYFLDGDKVLGSLLTRYLKNEKTAHIILTIFRFLAICLFLANIIIPIAKFGLQMIL